ncbi:MAG: Arc family DNA-binding protein [Rhodobacteraceae bacterium]|nr:Arc family DNA-binding protein [Paracoccaceae bacterium]
MSESATVQFKLNMPVSLRERLDAACQSSGRSVTAEIISRLEKSFEKDDDYLNALANIDELMVRMEALEKIVADLDHFTGRRDFPAAPF